ncbi:MAG: EVE domain-containing protein [Candidatus Hodarchaeales archaeon]
MPENIWLISHGIESYNNRKDLIGMGPNRRLVTKIQPDDYVIYYITGKKQILGTFEIIKEVFNGDKEYEKNWENRIIQYVIKDRVVRPENPLPVDRKLRIQLSYFGSRRNWGRSVQNTVSRIRYLEDFEIIEDLLRKG